MKVKLNAEQKKVVAETMKKARKLQGYDRDEHIARTIGDVYDVEIPISPVIEEVSRVERADVGEHVYYLVPTTITKEVNTITSDCEITQVKVTANALSEVTWVDLASKEVYVCLHDYLKADHNVLTFNGDALMEAMDRQEIYSVLNLADAGAVAEGNTFTDDSGKSQLDWLKLVDMGRSVAKYGTKLVLVTGANVTTDIKTMNYRADKNSAVSIFDIVDKHIPIEEFKVSINGVEKTVLDADTALIVAVADSKFNRSIVVARRKTSVLNEMFDTEDSGENKERVIVSSGNGINVGNKRKFGRGMFAAEEYSATALNNKVFVKYQKS